MLWRKQVSVYLPKTLRLATARMGGWFLAGDTWHWYSPISLGSTFFIWRLKYPSSSSPVMANRELHGIVRSYPAKRRSEKVSWTTIFFAVKLITPCAYGSFGMQMTEWSINLNRIRKGERKWLEFDFVHHFCSFQSEWELGKSFLWKDRVMEFDKNVSLDYKCDISHSWHLKHPQRSEYSFKLIFALKWKL